MNKIINLTVILSAILVASCASNASPTSNVVMKAPPKLKVSSTDLSVDPEFRSDAPNTYTVKKGDTLWGISKMFLSVPWRWKQIWHNNGNIKNPHKIYPGDILSIVTIGGKKRVQISKTSNSNHGKYAGKTSDGRPIYNMKPQISYEALDQEIPAVPISAVLPHLSKTRIVESGFSDDYPYIVSEAQGSYLSLSNRPLIYVKGDVATFEEYDVFREESTVVDPYTQEQLGAQLTYIGRVQKVKGANDEDISSFKLLNNKRRVLPNDILLPIKEVKPGQSLNFTPSISTQDVQPSIIRPLERSYTGSQFQTLIINAGTNDGLVKGNVFKIVRGNAKYGTGRDGEQYKLPNYEVGIAMIYRVYEGVSYALVMNSYDAIYPKDRLVAP